ncbi:MAG TPA: DUF1835 domain-containing protein [Candidatus Acidoferrum sp.]
MNTLHIVDGDSTGGSLRQAGFSRRGNILSWRDALYTGPVPGGLTLQRLSRLRSRFWTGRNATEFDKRNAVLGRHIDYDEVVLWFGPTSLCQLSLVQLLAWFNEHKQENAKLRLVSAYGGWLKPEELLQAYEARQPISPAQMRLAQRVWSAFCSPSPKALSRLLAADLGALPEIRGMISYILQEYPERQSGLSRLERKLLRTVGSLGVTTPAVVVGTTVRTELVGDMLLLDMLRASVTAPHPLLRFVLPFKGKLRSYQFNGSKIAVTDTGRAVLAGKFDHIALNGIDRWIGGVHLKGNRVRWRWDDRIRDVVSQYQGTAY